MDTQNTMVRNVILAALVVAAIGLGYWFVQRSAHDLPVASGDKIESWNFQGSHKDGGANEQKVRDEIVKMEAGLADAETDPTDYALYVGISNQYVLLGDGRAAYKALGKALEIDAEKTGLAWHNLGTLMERLGAINTARIAFDRAVESQSVVEIYHIARLKFLMKHFGSEVSAIDAAFQAMTDTFGSDYPPMMQLNVEWLTMQGKTDEAAEMQKKLQQRIGGVPQSGPIEAD